MRLFISLLLLCPFVGLTAQDFSKALWETQFQARATLLTQFVADSYRPPSLDIGDPEKYYWPKAMARFELYGQTDSMANAWLDVLHERSPFHFTLVGMARLMPRYWLAPSMQAHKKVILQKVFARTDGHNPWTSEGTENHISMARTSGYLFAQEALVYPDLFPEAPAKLASMKQWILSTSDKILRYGSGEWNSSIYEVYNMIGWLNLYDFANDPEVVEAALKVVDYYALEIALHYSFGAYGGSEMRGGGAVSHDRTAGAYLGWLWFSPSVEAFPKGFKGSQYIQPMHAVTSRYQPSTKVIQLAQKSRWQSAAWITGSKPSYIFEKKHFVKQFFYAAPSFTLGSSVSAYGGWTGSTYQYVPWKLVVKGTAHPFIVSGNGRFHDEWSAKARNAWTQHAQYKNVIIQMTQTPKNAEEITQNIKDIVQDWSKEWEKDFKQRFPNDHKKNIVNFNAKIINENSSFINFPQVTKLEIEKGKCLGELNGVYFIMHTLSGNQPEVQAFSGKKYKDRSMLMDTATKGKLCGFVIEVLEKSSFANWEDFTQQVKAHQFLDAKKVKKDGTIHYVSLMDDTLEASYELDGYFEEATVDWGFGPTKPGMFLSSPPFYQPVWPNGKNHGRKPLFKVNGKPMDWEAVTPVYKGEDFKVSGGEITFK